MRDVQTFEVSLKAFIVREGRALFVRESDTGYWELPGGRIDVGEEWEAHAAVLAREVREELGPGLRLRISSAAVTWTRQRPEDGMFQFIVARLAESLGGEPVLSGEHDALVWADAATSATLRFPERSGYAAAIPALWRLAE